jgi:hypothetical protein
MRRSRGLGDVYKRQEFHCLMLSLRYHLRNLLRLASLLRSGLLRIRRWIRS